MKAGVPGCQPVNGVAESGHDLLEVDVFDVAKSVRMKNRRNVSRLESGRRTLTHFLKLFGPLDFDLL
jgi:hypothetical protein